ncbi:MAG: hypothetical protein ING40_11130 [Burkholderiales bacterium]|jgi:hypothetical protein|nr:hypothetical protein [Burkholderiales bacterium]MCA3229573.1 hypothetical protein [Burkholderiales bacterium]
MNQNAGLAACTGAACKAWAAALSAIALAGCQPQAALMAGQVLESRARPALSHGPTVETLRLLQQHAFSALVVPVLDDGDITRFADVALAPVCGDTTEVRVDGRPVVPGAAVPAGAFTLQWTLGLFCPFGVDGPTLDGRADVLVFRDDQYGMQALVQPRGLTVSDGQGALRLDAGAPALLATQWQPGVQAAAREQ